MFILDNFYHLLYINKILDHQAEAKESKQIADNAKKAKEAADCLFPGEKWKLLEDRIFLSSHRPSRTDAKFLDELRDAQVLRNYGGTVYLVPEIRQKDVKQYDAIVNGFPFEFKNVVGGESALLHRFLKSRAQAPNVFINLEKSDLTRHRIMSTLYHARNKPSSKDSPGYTSYNKFSGGSIVLKIKGSEHLIYLNVDDLKLPQK